MSNHPSQTPSQPLPPDQPQRERALDPTSSVLVQAPAGSGKTDLLTRRFLRLLTEVEDPSQIVAITFTKAAAAEMRHRILSKLEAAAQIDGANAAFSNKGTASAGPQEPQQKNRALAPEGNLSDPFSMESLAHRAHQHSQALGWNLLDQPAQLRISTIDSFCRDLALQQPLLTGLGDGLGIYDQPDELYRRAARQALEQIDSSDAPLREAIETLLLWRDNNWQEMENQLVEMLKSRDRWMRDFVLDRERDWESLRENLERPFATAIQQALAHVAHLLDHVPGAREEAHALARFACQQGASALFQPLAELPDFPEHDLTEPDELEQSRGAHLCLADLLLTQTGSFRKQVTKTIGFPADRKQEKSQILDLVARLSAIPGLESALADLRTLPPARYTDEDWQIIRACFTLLRNAAAQLKVVFAETGSVDYVEVAQIALSVLRAPDGQPTDAAITIADKIHHILVDEFQDTSRRQHELLRRLIAAWPDREGRSCFVVGDPMQSIYFFRDADAELFPRVREAGLEMPDAVPAADPLLFTPVALTANFRTARPLVTRLNEVFTQVFAAIDGSGVTFSPAIPARKEQPDLPPQSNLDLRINETAHREQNNRQTTNPSSRTSHPISGGPGLASETWDRHAAGAPGPSPLRTGESTSAEIAGTPSIRRLSYEWVGEQGVNLEQSGSGTPSKNFALHINFTSQSPRNTATMAASPNDSSRPIQIEEIVNIIRSHADAIEQCRQARELGDKERKYRIAVLGRTRNALAPIAQALRAAKIRFRAVDLEKLSARPEVLDALALARAILNPLDRVSWLGTLRAPWCGLSLADLHTLTSADSPQLLVRPIPELLAERASLLTPEGRAASERVLAAVQTVPALRFAQPTASLGTWLERLWLRLGGAYCVDRTARANLDLLWQSLDALPNGELDLCGPALSAALNSLTAQPDPGVSGDCGVQLMTIHKSKGLEFEVVIVPELQARSRHGETKLLSWLERGLPPEDDANDDASDPDNAEATEFLVAPLQFKGSDRGTTKKWVDRVYRDRESQEIRRLLYVAATRARDELHLFAQPAIKRDKSGDWTLTEPKDSLLATAWPALQSDIEDRFAQWISAQAASKPEPITLDLAASADTNLLIMPTPPQPTTLRRLPPTYNAAPPSDCHPERVRRGGRVEGPASWSSESSTADLFPSSLVPSFPGSLVPSFPALPYQRHEGNLLSRALGTAVHTLLEALSNLRQTNDEPAARAALHQLAPRIAAQIRAIGIDPTQSASLAAEALKLALNASADPTGSWILSPHAEDSSEARFAGVVSNSLRTVQVDRLFRAGLSPLSTGADAWWIVDYKTAHADIPDPASALPALRTLFAPQLETYARILANLHGKSTPIRAGLYYPRMLLFDWWEISHP